MTNNPLLRVVLLGVLLLVATFLVSQGVTVARFEYAIVTAAVLAVFIFVFIKTEAGLYLVLFSMLLSPEFALGGASLAERRTIVVRLEDLLLIAITFSWFAKTAVNKEIGLVVKTPLNPWILFYVMSALFSTALGYLQGTVKNATGFFYVLKYVEYFIVYYMTVNNVRDREQAWRLVMAAFVTAAMVSVIGAAQIPSGQRVSAPFEGEAGEPNSFGGYLLLMMAIAAGIALETGRLKTRVWAVGLVGLMAVPFLFTLSRSSYLAVLPAAGMLALLSSRRKVMIAALGLLVLVSPIIMTAAPEPVKKRILYTFQPERGQAMVKVGQVTFDPSTSERLLSMQEAFAAWTQRPLLGFGVTGFRFMDAQYARTLVETGLLGLAAFLALLWAVFKVGIASVRRLDGAEDRGVAVGFVAGTIGLLVHAIGSNSFIIIRIMEPFWFFAGVVAILPTLPPKEAAAPARRPIGALGYSV
jgi:O-antigen ligase